MWQTAFLSVLYSGKIPFAPGTWGSLVSVFLGLPLLYFSQETLFLLAILLGGIAIKQITIYEQNGGMHDDKSIVIDELVGVWIAMSFINLHTLSMYEGIVAVGLSFVFFRIFDIWKPSFIGKIDREVKGGLGVVGDDALAGFVAGICVLLVMTLWSIMQ
ncbi:phosphatidylglycerophosphatase A [uncultured Helicobacter sp.]|uniref:phosphatidylglycerophosphatase A family protein n=1 Tax=uncultured Helicobacter sp. TaxID=175537 RepID=UPI00374F74AD